MSQRLDLPMHRRYLSALLADIGKTAQEKIAFKGGTCASFFYQLPRFSFDLDFDILKDFRLEDRSLIAEILSRHGTIKESYDKKHTLFYLFDYGKGYPNIKVEMNKRVWKSNRYKPEWFMGVALLIPDESSLLTNKIVALTDRRSPVARDLFDTWYFLQAGYTLNDALILERTGKDTAAYLDGAVKFIEKNYTPRNILQGLGESLDEKQKVWAKAHLITLAIQEIKKRIQ
ncbi:MAG: nucleotidyl transferase AbiEii/AbiGii toxin family protein [Elusimicrobia bacterium]|nr:nucleotidyl transferase AbiEii/AbiGii toxin family protein [Elusimicrobiota bacterium]